MINTFAKRIRQYKKESILTPIFVAGEVALECVIPLLMAKLIDEFSEDTFLPIIKYGVMLIIMAMFSLAFGIMSGKKAATASCGFAKNLRQDLFYKVQDFSFQDIDKFSTASLVTRLTTDVTNIQNAFQMLIRVAVRTPLMLIFSVVMSMTINIEMSLIFIIMIPILGIALGAIIYIVFPIFKKIFKKYDALNNSIQENIAGVRVVKSFVREEYEKENFDVSADEVRRDFTRAEKIIALNNPLMMASIFIAITLVSFFGAKIIINTEAVALTTGELSSLINYGIQILISMMMLSMVFVMLSMAVESAKRITEVLEHECSLTNPENPDTEITDGSIEFKNVCFKYSKDSEKNVLENINLKIESGQTIGIIGGTGSSKSSLVQLIPRLYDISEGEVLVGGKDVRSYDLFSLRNEVAFVLQKNVLFSGTISQNIRWGGLDASDEDVQRVCRLAQADEFIQMFEEKYETHIEQGGSNVSGGQKQRLCIARALLKKPKILILDDSTSAVDTKTDALIRKALNSEIPDTTKIIIAQRVSSVESADKIIVLENGKIAEEGTHEELLGKNGIYKEEYITQTRNKEVS